MIETELYKQRRQFIKSVNITNELLKIYSEAEYNRAVQAAIDFIDSNKMTKEIWTELARRSGHSSPSAEVKTMVRQQLQNRLAPPRPDGTEFEGLTT